MNVVFYQVKLSVNFAYEEESIEDEVDYDDAKEAEADEDYEEDDAVDDEHSAELEDEHSVDGIAE